MVGNRAESGSQNKYATIVADPPWDQKGGPLTGGVGEGFLFAGPMYTRDLPYPTMSVDEIAALEVAQLATPDCALYLWATNRYVDAAYDIARSWGFEPSTLCVWAKEPMGGGLGGDAFGISTEFFLYARKGSPDVKFRVRGTWFNWKRPYVNGKPSHSRKPKEFYRLVELQQRSPYLEMFARQKQSGWHVWGNEIPNDVEVA